MRVNPYGQYALELSSHSDLFQGQTARSRKNENGSGSAGAAKTARESIWHKVAALYDVSSLTEDELADMARELWSDGAITYQDYAMMSPKADSDDTGKKTDGRYLTQADERGARDWLNEYEQLSQFLLDKGETPTAQLVQRVLSVLTQVKLARGGPLDLRV